MKILAIAVNTFREAVRHRVFYVLLLFAAGLMLVARFLGELTVGDKVKIVADVGLAGISLACTLIGVFLGIGLVSRELERRTAYVLLAKPVTRHQFVFGKAFGLAAVIALVAAFLSAELLVVMFIFTGEWKVVLMQSALLAFWEAAVLMATAMVFSTFTTPVLASLYTFAFFVIGHLSWTFRMLADRSATAAREMFWNAWHVALPNLERFNIRSELVHGVEIDPWLRVGAPCLYGFFYATALLLLASALFERKDLV